MWSQDQLLTGDVERQKSSDDTRTEGNTKANNPRVQKSQHFEGTALLIG